MALFPLLPIRLCLKVTLPDLSPSRDYSLICQIMRYVHAYSVFFYLGCERLLIIIIIIKGPTERERARESFG